MAILIRRKYCLLALLVPLAGCAQLNTQLKLLRACMMQKMEPKPLIIEAEGYALINAQRGPSYEEKLQQAMEASRLEAYTRLAEKVYGYRIHSHEIKVDGETTHTKVDVQVDGLIKGASIVTHGIDGKVYTTKLSLDSSMIDKLSSFNTTETQEQARWWY